MIDRDKALLRNMFAHEDVEQAFKTLLLETFKDTSISAKELFYATQNMKNIVMDIKQETKSKSLM